MENKNIEKLVAEYDSVAGELKEEREKLKSINDQIRIELEKENKEFSDSMKGKILLMDSDSQVVILVVDKIDFVWNHKGKGKGKGKFKWAICGKEYSYFLEEGYCRISNERVYDIPDMAEVYSLAQVKEYIAETCAEISEEELRNYKNIILERFVK